MRNTLEVKPVPYNTDINFNAVNDMRKKGNWKGKREFDNWTDVNGLVALSSRSFNMLQQK